MQRAWRRCGVRLASAGVGVVGHTEIVCGGDDDDENETAPRIVRSHRQYDKLNKGGGENAEKTLWLGVKRGSGRETMATVGQKSPVKIAHVHEPKDVRAGEKKKSEQENKIPDRHLRDIGVPSTNEGRVHTNQFLSLSLLRVSHSPT